MQLDLGTKIRNLRRRDSRTQEVLAEALGVTSQAVSRWESGGSYPDMNLIPSIANYFNVTIDELFGYTGTHDNKAEMLMKRVNEMMSQNNGRDVCTDECILLARQAMVEFPGNGKVMLCLASALYQAGYVRHGEHHLTDDEGYSVYDAKRHRTYAEWKEAIPLYEKALNILNDTELSRLAVRELSQLYVNTGAYEKALALAESAPDLWGCCEFLRIRACDGKEQAKAYSEALLKTIRACTELIVNETLLLHQHMTPAQKSHVIQSAIGLFSLICSDGNMGEHHAWIGKLYMLLSAYLWQDGQHDEAFASLDNTLEHFKAYEALSEKGKCSFTAPLVQLARSTFPRIEVSLTANLPEDWPWWNFPEAASVKAEMSADPRWHAWSAKARS